jgi:hypothetical protein
LQVQGPETTWPSWVEITKSGFATAVGRFVGGHGSARPIGRVDLRDDGFSFAIPPQWEQGSGDLRVQAERESDDLRGQITNPDGSTYHFTGTRAADLLRSTPPVWGEPITLFNGVDLRGWRVIQGAETWSAVDGILVNAQRGGNLITEQLFDDFKLHLDVRYAPDGNSGIYLRGRYEVQILDGPTYPPSSTLQGGIYGFLTPSEVVTSGPDTWQSFDLELVGRHVTIAINGVTVIANQIIPGITGGALDADEAAPGPIMLQGDHTAVEYRNIVITPAM